MRKVTTIVMAGIVFLLTGCENQLPEDELVNNGQAFEMKQAEDDLQAGNFHRVSPHSPGPAPTPSGSGPPTPPFWGGPAF